MPPLSSRTPRRWQNGECNVLTLKWSEIGEYSQKELDESLFYAINSEWDTESIIEKLIAAGADVNAHTSTGATPLSLAGPNSCAASVLLKHGAK